MVASIPGAAVVDTSSNDCSDLELERIRLAYQRYANDDGEFDKRDPQNEGLQWLIAEWRSRLAIRLRALGQPTPRTRILDLGCGNGELLRWLTELGADPSLCVGVDLIEERIARARATLPGAQFECGDAGSIGFAAGSFDLVCMSMIVSSILDPALSTAVCETAARALSPQGVIVLYDTRYPNPFNGDVRSTSIRDARKLFPGFRFESETISLIPPLARRLGRTTPRAYRLLSRVPVLRARRLSLLFPPGAANMTPRSPENAR
ncbi:MAG: class I SAM-dependent methyltransferase [Solirubrobacterales bacterium]